jgi:histidinol-phosphatase (PHP family)
MTTTGLVDYHVHTARCGHAEGGMRDYVRGAVAGGVREMGFSDHLYLYWLDPHARDPELAMLEQELAPYVAEVELLRQEFPDLPLRLGVEADYIADSEDALRAALGRHEWDYVLGSVHFIGDWGFDDSRHLRGYEGWDIDQLYETYFDLACRAAESGCFDTIAHLDLIKKFGHRPERPPIELYRRVARRLAASGVAIEVNTAGLRKPCAEMYPAPDLLRECARAGVPATLGSDAHSPREVTADFDSAVALLRAAGYDRIVTYRERKREWLALP